MMMMMRKKEIYGLYGMHGALDLDAPGGDAYIMMIMMMMMIVMRYFDDDDD